MSNSKKMKFKLRCEIQGQYMYLAVSKKNKITLTNKIQKARSDTKALILIKMIEEIYESVNFEFSEDIKLWTLIGEYNDKKINEIVKIHLPRT